MTMEEKQQPGTGCSCAFLTELLRNSEPLGQGVII